MSDAAQQLTIREGDDQDYFKTFAGKGYALGVNVAVWVMAH